MPRNSQNVTTPFSELLEDYRWSRRLMPGQLAYKIGVSPQGLNAWLHAGAIPSPQRLADISERLDIPLADLYRAAGIRLPPPPPPQPYTPERQYTEDELWDRMIERTVATLRANGITDEALLQAVVAQIRDQQHGTDRVREVAAEFAPPSEQSTVPELPAVPPAQLPSPPSQPRRTSERHERRSPTRSTGRAHST